jgi:hypothetical protein
MALEAEARSSAPEDRSMIAFMSSLPASGLALAMGLAAGSFWITVRAHHRLERRRAIMRHMEPCRRCGARN